MTQEFTISEAYFKYESYLKKGLEVRRIWFIKSFKILEYINDLKSNIVLF